MRYGYARATLYERDISVQAKKLTQWRCTRVFTDGLVNRREDRPGLKECFSQLQSGDILVITKLHQLARDMKELREITSELQGRAIGLVSIEDRLDTTAIQDVFGVFMRAIEFFERSRMRQRTQIGLNAAKGRGGRKPKMTPEKLEAAKTMLRDGLSPKEIARRLELSLSTFYAHIPGGKA